MVNKNRKTKSMFEKIKKILTYLWPFSKKIKTVYNLKSIGIPRTSGRSLKILLLLIRLPFIKNLFLPLLLRQAGLKIFRKFCIEENPIMSPNHFSNNKISTNLAKKSITDFLEIIEGKNNREVKEKKVNPENSSLFKPESAIDFRKAYLEGRTNPFEKELLLLE